MIFEQSAMGRVSDRMTPTADSLRALLIVKRQRLSMTRSPRSREVLKRELQRILQQVNESAPKPL